MPLNTWNCWLLTDKISARVYAAFKSGAEAEKYANELNNGLTIKIPFKIEVVPGMEYSDAR